jgi:hypothetical protein
MAISRGQLVKELEPGLNALFGLEYKRYENQHLEIFDVETSDRAFEEEVMLSGFANAEIKPEGSAVVFDNAQETFTARYTHNTVALAFSTSYVGGDGVSLVNSSHPTIAGSFSNTLATQADLNETSLEQSLIDINAFTDERGLKIAAQGVKLIIPKELQFTAERLMKSALRTGTADNDTNAIRSMGMVPQGYVVNNFLTDTDAFFIKTDVPNGMKMFVRAPIKTAMEGDFDTGNVRYKARERYSFGWSDPRGIFGSQGSA